METVLKIPIVMSLIISLLAYWPGVTSKFTSPAVALSTGPRQTCCTDSKELEGFINGVMADEMKSNHIPGAVVSMVKDGRLIFEKGYGYSDNENSEPVDPERTLFRVGSVSKLFVWTAVMQLVEQGRLSLDADVNNYLDFKLPTTYPQPITMKNLMSHTAGFEGSDQGLLKKRPEELIPLEQYVKTGIPAQVFPPGKIELYSNYGGALASYIVERVSGMSFNDYIEKNILIPLEMTHSTFRQPLPADLATSLAHGYHLDQGRYVKGGFEYIVPYPVGSLSSTGGDMARFMLAHLQNGQLGDNRILSDEITQQMHSQLFTHDPRITGMAYGFYEDFFNGQRVLSHGGATILFYSKLYLIPEQNLGLFISTNAPGGASAREVLFKKFMDHYFPAALTAVQCPAADFTSRVTPYLGTYYQAYNFTTAEKLLSGLTQYKVSLDANNNLIATAGGQTIQFVEIEPGLFHDRNNANEKLVLYTDEYGRAYLLSSEPFPLVKVPWYGTILFQALLIASGLLLFMLTMIGWTMADLTRLRKRQPYPVILSLARRTGVSFGMVLIVILADWIYLMLNKDPAFGTPAITFGLPPLITALYGLAYFLAVLGVLMLGFALFSWVRCLWNLAGRLHYSLLALSALSLLWVLSYWNLL